MLTLIDSLGLGGAEMLLAELATGAASADLRLSVGYLRARDGNPAEARLRTLGVEPQPVPITGLIAPRSVASVRRHIAAVAPDVVHTHLGYSDFLGGLAGRSLGVPVLSTIHLANWDTPDGVRDRLKFQLFAQVRRRCASRVITVSEAARRTYLDRGWDEPDHVVTVHNGVRDGRPALGGRAPTPSEMRSRLGIDADDLVVTMVSVLRGGKGHEAAFDAVRRLAADDPTIPLRLLVLGDGPAAAEIRLAAEPLGRRVVMLGHRDDVASILAVTDVLLHPSPVDAFPTALLEAMASGVPVIATRVGGIPEIVQDGTTGCLVPGPPSGEELATALHRMSADPPLRRSMGSAGRQRYEDHFTAERWAGRLRQVYETAIDGST